MCLGLRLARLVTLKWLGQRPLNEKMYDLPLNGIRSWIMKTYETRKILLKLEMYSNSVSKIHISFDL
jgi:hypothetical protein